MPHSGNTTADPQSIDFSSDEDDSPRMVPALTLLWCRNEPHRVGETALLDGTGRFFLGRDGKVLDALTFVRMRPGVIERTGPLTMDILSSRQLELEVDGDQVGVTCIGRRDLFVNGEKTKCVRLRAGDVLLIEGCALLLFSMRPASIPKLERQLAVHSAHAGGTSMAFACPASAGRGLRVRRGASNYRRGRRERRLERCDGGCRGDLRRCHDRR